MSSLNFTGQRGPNPYRSGVLIGNYVEDMFGLDLQQKYGNLRRSADYTKLSENQDEFRWPKYKLEQLGKTGNDLTMSCNMNYDLNIDFSRKKPEDFKNLKKSNEYSVDNKNIFMPDEIRIMKYKKLLEDEKNNIIRKENMETQSQNALSQINAKDASTLLFTKKTGLSGNLLFRHGDQQNINKEFINNQNEYKRSFKMNAPLDKDFSDWGYRKYREYGYFTKKFDKKKKK